MTTPLKNTLKNTLIVAAVAMSTQAMAQVTLYEGENFDGRSYTVQQQVDNLQRHGFNDRASSATVAGQPGQRWEVCEDARFGGRCAVLRPGGYPSLASMGLDNRHVTYNFRGQDHRIQMANPPGPTVTVNRQGEPRA